MGWHGPRGSCGCCDVPPCDVGACDCGDDGCIGPFEFKFLNITATIGGGLSESCYCPPFFTTGDTGVWWQFECALETLSIAQPIGITGESGLWVVVAGIVGNTIAACPLDNILHYTIWCKLVITTDVTITVQIEYRKDGVDQWARFVWVFPIVDGVCPVFDGTTEYSPDTTSYSGTAVNLCDLLSAEAVLR